MAENIKCKTVASGLASLTADHHLSVMGDNVNVVVHHHAMLFTQQGFHGFVRASAWHECSR